MRRRWFSPPVEGLTVTSRVGYRLESTNYSFYGVPTYFAVSSRTKMQLDGKTTMNRFYMWENFANYNNTFGKHTINAMVGMSYQYEWSNFTSGSTNGLTDSSSNFHHLDFASTDATKGVGGRVGEISSISYFGRVGYTFDNRYNIMVNFRADAFDRLQIVEGSPLGLFPLGVGRVDDLQRAVHARYRPQDHFVPEAPRFVRCQR